MFSLGGDVTPTKNTLSNLSNLPNLNNLNFVQETPTPGANTKLQQTPTNLNQYGGMTPTPYAGFNLAATPTHLGGMTPLANLDNISGFNDMSNITMESIDLIQPDSEMVERNRLMTDEEIDKLLDVKGYELIRPPANYQPKLRKPSLAQQQTPSYQMPTESTFNLQDNPNLPGFQPEEAGYFSELLKDVDESKLSTEELRDRSIMTLLLKIKNGTPPMRKSALRQLTEKAREFGAGPLFNQILPCSCHLHSKYKKDIYL